MIKLCFPLLFYLTYIFVQRRLLSDPLAFLSSSDICHLRFLFFICLFLYYFPPHFRAHFPRIIFKVPCISYIVVWPSLHLHNNSCNLLYYLSSLWYLNLPSYLSNNYLKICLQTPSKLPHLLSTFNIYLLIFYLLFPFNCHFLCNGFLYLIHRLFIHSLCV